MDCQGGEQALTLAIFYLSLSQDSLSLTNHKLATRVLYLRSVERCRGRTRAGRPSNLQHRGRCAAHPTRHPDILCAPQQPAAGRPDPAGRHDGVPYDHPLGAALGQGALERLARRGPVESQAELNIEVARRRLVSSSIRVPVPPRPERPGAAG